MSNIEGLTWNQATKALRIYGENKIPTPRTSKFKIFIRQIYSPLLLLLIFTASVFLLLGDTLNAVVVTIIIIVNTFLGFFQEYKANNAFLELEKLISSKVTVLRDHKKTVIDKSAIVPDDIIFLKLGDVVCADAYVLEQENFTVDESMFTGESEVIYKKENPSLKRNFKEGIIYAGSYVKNGCCTAKVFATGTQSKYGEIAKLTLQTKSVSEYQQTLKKLSWYFMIIAILAVIFIFGSHIIVKRDFDFISTLLFTVAIAIAIIPEALPVVANLTLAKSALKLGHQKVIVKRNESIEELGNIEVICTDKTGTLTLNKLKVAYFESVLPKKDFLRYSYLSAAESTDSIDTCILNYLKYHNVEEQSEFLLEEIPFDPVKKFSSRKFKDFEIIKGSPEYILSIAKNDTDEIRAQIADSSQNGLRVISLAVKEKRTVKYIGSYFFYDEIRSEAEKVVQAATRMGIDLKIITGDSKEVSSHVAKTVGLIKDDAEIILAEELDFDNQDKLCEQVESHKVFARCNPLEKYKIIECLQKKRYVGYIGDGINDAPSLALANVSIVVDNATDIAKKESDIILLSPDLEVIIEGIKQGRTTFENINKYLKVTLAGNFGSFLTIGILSVFLDYLPMLPIQVLLTNLLTDIPLLAIVTDSVDKDAIKKPKHHYLNKIILFSVVFGIVSSIFDLIFFYLVQNQQPAAIQTQWFTLSIFTELFALASLRTKHFIFSKKALKPSYTLIFLAIICLLITIMLALLGLGTEFSSISLISLAFVAVIAFVYVVINEIVKLPIVKLLKF